VILVSPAAIESADASESENTTLGISFIFGEGSGGAGPVGGTRRQVVAPVRCARALLTVSATRMEPPPMRTEDPHPTHRSVGGAAARVSRG